MRIYKNETCQCLKLKESDPSMPSDHNQFNEESLEFPKFLLNSSLFSMVNYIKEYLRIQYIMSMSVYYTMSQVPSPKS